MYLYTVNVSDLASCSSQVLISIKLFVQNLFSWFLNGNEAESQVCPQTGSVNPQMLLRLDFQFKSIEEETLFNLGKNFIYKSKITHVVWLKYNSKLILALNPSPMLTLYYITEWFHSSQMLHKWSRLHVNICELTRACRYTCWIVRRRKTEQQTFSTQIKVIIQTLKTHLLNSCFSTGQQKKQQKSNYLSTGTHTWS